MVDETGTVEAKPTGGMGANYWKLLSASVVSNLGDGIGLIAYPWLASAITRNPILIAGVAVAQRIPWLVFSLPAGVITDRVDRRKLMVSSNVVRAIITLIVAFAVLGRQGVLPGPDEVLAAAETSESLGLYALVLIASFLLGLAEVLYDNAGQTLMPSVVPSEHLEKANGRLWSSEQVVNTMIGPPLGAFLLAFAFALPFFVDAASFALSAVLITLISIAPSSDSGEGKVSEPQAGWRSELAEGVRWLWANDLLRPMAIILGLMNMFFMVSASVLVLFAQEILSTSPTEFALLSTGGAVGGILGGLLGPAISKKLGTGPSLMLTLAAGGLSKILIGMTSSWPVVWILTGGFMLLGTLWNVITVSLRQTIIPDHLLGRVNSVYRFFAWGMIPIGAIIGGLVVVVTERFGSRELALRMPWFVSGIGQLGLLVFAAKRLTTAKMDAARSAAKDN